MMRITVWQQNGTAPPNTSPGAAIAAFNDAVAARTAKMMPLRLNVFCPPPRYLSLAV